MSSLGMSFNPKDLMDGLDALHEGIVTKVIRPAAFEAARVYRDEAIARAPRAKKGHWFYGTTAKSAPKGQKRKHAYWIEPGTLANAIYVAYSKDNSQDGSYHTYHVSWNKKKAPHGFMVEFGTSRAAPKPFLRPAYHAAGPQAIEAARKVIIQKGNEVIHGLRG